jgi:hypothetical protein
MTSNRFVLLAAAALALATVALPATADDRRSSRETLREIEIGRKIAPVPLTIAMRDPNSVYLGSYLVNAVADCNGCHSNNEFTATGNPFHGKPKEVNATCYLNGGQAFGPFLSRNLTPDSSGMPAGITFATFVKALRTGDDPQEPGTLLQVMPWPTFQNMTIVDLKAIYDYLSSIPSLPPGGLLVTPPATPPC